MKKFAKFHIALYLGAFSSSFSMALDKAPEKPNIIILYADDMGVADISYGDPKAKIQTPNIDLLAKGGMTFSDGHSSSGICTPSRYALLTGKHHWRKFHGIVNAYKPTVFDKDEFTIARMLKKQGYTTACFGKWHLGWDWNAIRKPEIQKKDYVKADSYDWSKPFPDGPIDQGFDYYFGDGTINFPPYCWIENDRFLTIPVKPVIKSNPLAGGGSFRPGPMADDWNPYKILPTITEKTAEWIEQHDTSKPFFIYLAFNSPHYPILPNKPFHGKSSAGFYGDFVIETDAMVGKVLDAVEKKGISDNTIVIFTADNGAETHAFQRLQKFDQWSSGNFRGVKRDVYEGGHRVPFIVRWPNKIKAGSQSDEVINQVDLASTFAQVSGYQLNKEEAMDSYNLLPVLEQVEYKKPLRTATVQNTHSKTYAIRQGDWVYINSNSGATQKEPPPYLKKLGLTTFKEDKKLLFNLKKDPRQANNLIKEEPERANTMNTLLEQYLDGKRCAPLPQ